MVKEVDIEVRMIAAISEALNYKRKNPPFDTEKILKHISKFIKQEKSRTQIAMIAATSKAVGLIEKDNSLADREIIKKIMPELKEISNRID